MPTLAERFVYDGPSPADVSILDNAATLFLDMANQMEAALPDNHLRAKAINALEEAFRLSIMSVLRKNVPPPALPPSQLPPAP